MERLTLSGPAVLEPEIVDAGATSRTGDWVVVVWDNPINTVDEVVAILIEATLCDEAEAATETWEIHHLGKSVVHHGGREPCEEAARVIATIGIRVEVMRESVDA